MSRPEEIKPLARRDDEPVFDEPWQAQALALAFTLAERGIFTPAQWSQTLGNSHRELLSDGAPDTPQTYYEAVAISLEILLSNAEGLDGEAIETRTGEWREAYLTTPHGQPVVLKNMVCKS